jgi:coenzyme PQQ biosynthesis protein PqqD
MTNLSQRPALKSGCRLSREGDVLLIPEGALRLHGPSARILQGCDGRKSVQQIIDQLLQEFPTSDPAKIAEETSSFLLKLAERGAIVFTEDLA